MVKVKNEYGILDPIAIHHFELDNKIVLPDDYKSFLSETNGGEPIFSRISQPDAIVSYILGMHDGPFFSSLHGHLDIFHKRLPFCTFPIATDPFGNLFILSLHQQNYGQIYFWDHEGEPVVQDGHYIDNCIFVAHSFSAFLNFLR